MAVTDPPRSLAGMHDLLPPNAARWRALRDAFVSVFESMGYQEVATPVLETLAVFQRVGEGTDVVTKEMYEFVDRDGTVVALRPESTAGVARAFVQHRPATPWKVWYQSAHFRHERAQKGRTRQHHQLGVECFGVADADLDVEVIVGLWDLLGSLGLRRVRLLINDIGTAAQRARFVDALRAALAAHRDDIDPDDRPKLAGNTLRILDSKRPATRAVVDAVELPKLADFVDDESRERFARVRAGLDAAGVDHVVEPSLVRGLDYYNGTVFEVVSDAIDAAQSTIGGGGRYDGLIESLGGPPTPAFGFGAGIERILLACDAESTFPTPVDGPDVFVVSFGGDALLRDAVRELSLGLRRGGIRVGRGYDGRSGRAQMKAADRSGARYAVLVGDDELASGTVTIRHLVDDVPQRRVDRAEFISNPRTFLP